MIPFQVYQSVVSVYPQSCPISFGVFLLLPPVKPPLLINNDPLPSPPPLPSATGNHKSTFCLYRFLILDISHKQNYTTHVLCVWLFSPSILVSRSHCVTAGFSHSLLGPSNTFHCVTDHLWFPRQHAHLGCFQLFGYNE